MTDAREKHDEALLGAIAEGIWQGHRRKVHHYRHDWAPLVIDSLHASGFRILGPDDVDPVTLEKAADAAEEQAEWVPLKAGDMRATILALATEGEGDE